MNKLTPWINFVYLETGCFFINTYTSLSLADSRQWKRGTHLRGASNQPERALHAGARGVFIEFRRSPGCPYLFGNSGLAGCVKVNYFCPFSQDPEVNRQKQLSLRCQRRACVLHKVVAFSDCLPLLRTAVCAFSSGYSVFIKYQETGSLEQFS